MRRKLFRGGYGRSETTNFGFYLNCNFSVTKYLLSMLTNISRIIFGTSFYHQKYFTAYISISLIEGRVQYFVWDHTVSVEFNSNQGQSVPRYWRLLHCSQIASHVMSKRNQVKSLLTIKAMYQKPCSYWWEIFKIKKKSKDKYFKSIIPAIIVKDWRAHEDKTIHPIKLNKLLNYSYGQILITASKKLF